MSRIRLSDGDREQHGGPEWLEWDPDKLTVSEAEALQENLGVSVGDYWKWMPSAGVAGIKWAAWLSLRRAGGTVGWQAFDPDLGRMVVVNPEPEPEATPEGKAPSRSTRQRRSAGSAKK